MNSYNLKRTIFGSMIFALLLLSSCEKNEQIISNTTLNLQDKNIEFQGLEAILPKDYPLDILSYGPDDLEAIYLKSNANSRIAGNEAPLTPDEFDKAMEKILKKYPSLSKIDDNEIEKAKKYFPKMDKKQAYENWQTVLDYVEKLIGYDVALEVSQKKKSPKNGRVNYLMTPLNSCEFWFIAGNARMKSGVETASSLAFEKELYATGESSHNYQGRGDAIRHAIWNIYIGKYACDSYGEISKAAEKIKGFTDAHECTSPEGADKEMDLHNNAVGIEYYKMIAQRVKVGCFLGICNHNVVIGLSDNTIADITKGRSLILSTDVTTIQNTNLGTLVRIINN